MSKIYLLISGTRLEKDINIVKKGLQYCLDTIILDNPQAKELVVYHGKAKGVDLIADSLFKQVNKLEFYGLKIEVKGFDANWNLFGKKAGILRNQEMIDELTLIKMQGNIIYGYSHPHLYEESRGTRHCTELMKEAKFKVITREMVLW